MPDSQPLQRFKAEFFKALSHPTRIRILETLRGGPHTVSELQALLEIDGWEERRNVGLYWRESSGRQRHYIALAEAAAVAASSLGIET